jgi:hypothetical protein
MLILIIIAVVIGLLISINANVKAGNPPATGTGDKVLDSAMAKIKAEGDARRAANKLSK